VIGLRRHFAGLPRNLIVDNGSGLQDCESKMKTTITAALCAVALLAGSIMPAQAEDNSSLAVAADVVIARPACLVATIVGSALFLVCLPVAIPSKSVKKVADTLVVAPAKATFTRPLGELSSLDAGT
jgi:hypothetical protein